MITLSSSERSVPVTPTLSNAGGVGLIPREAPQHRTPEERKNLLPGNAAAESGAKDPHSSSPIPFNRTGKRRAMRLPRSAVTRLQPFTVWPKIDSKRRQLDFRNNVRIPKISND
jgi:hypothetical protein